MVIGVLVQGLALLWLGSGVGRRWCNIAYKVISCLVAGVVLQHFVSLHIVVGLLYV